MVVEVAVSDRVKTNLEHVAEENPLMVAIGATVLGLGLDGVLADTEGLRALA